MPRTTEQCHNVRHVITMYLAQARRDLSPRSYETVACILSRFDAVCGRLTLADCRPFDLQCWLNDHPEYHSEWDLRCVVSTIKRAFNWACEMELIQRNPFAKLRRRGRTQRRQPMTDDEFQTLLRGSDPTFRRFLVFLKLTGARPGEAASMRWGDVDFEQAAVVLKEHKTIRKTGRRPWTSSAAALEEPFPNEPARRLRNRPVPAAKPRQLRRCRLHRGRTIGVG
jgi:integrase